MKKTKAFLRALAAVLLAGCLLLPACKEERGPLKRIWYDGSYNRDFNDLNDVQLATARKIGIRPAKTREEAEKAKKKMKEIRSGAYYEVEELSHSIPYLIPQAAVLLHDIGKNFQDSLASLNAPLYKVKVTSLTRTVADTRKLKKRNVNSSSRSTHQYGTTFDISWNRYAKMDAEDTLDIGKDELKMVLAMVLRDLKRAGRCYVKHERRQGCFHITVKEKK